MPDDLRELLQRCVAAHEHGRALLDHQLQLIAARGRLRRQGLTVLEEFTDLARTFCDTAASRRSS
jgi:hypothetical protein